MLDIQKLRDYAIPDTRQTWTRKDSMLYGVGVGYGFDPMDERQLPYCTEKGQRTVPTMATVTAAPHGFIKKANVGSSGNTVHSGIHVRMNRPLPLEGEFLCKVTLGEVLDKGPGKAALLTTHRKTYLAGQDDPIFEIATTSMLRGDGGFGGPNTSSLPDPIRPEGQPDLTCDLPTYPHQALVYRLSGDYNPLHSDPEAAARQGFPRPILHGLCTFGVAGHALVRSVCDYDADRLTEIGGRFSKPVYPGETLRTKIWNRGDGRIEFLVTVPARDDVIVLDYGTARTCG